MCRWRSSARWPISCCRSTSCLTCCRCSASPTTRRCSPRRCAWSPAHIGPEHRDAARRALTRGSDAASERCRRREAASSVIRWLMSDAPQGRRLERISGERSRHRLRAAGVDVARITTGVPILHPQIVSFSGLWEVGKGASERRLSLRRQPQASRSTTARSASPISGGGPVRCRLTDPPSATANFRSSRTCARTA